MGHGKNRINYCYIASNFKLELSFEDYIVRIKYTLAKCSSWYLAKSKCSIMAAVRFN